MGGWRGWAHRVGGWGGGGVGRWGGGGGYVRTYSVWVSAVFVFVFVFESDGGDASISRLRFHPPSPSLKRAMSYLVWCSLAPITIHSSNWEVLAERTSRIWEVLAEMTFHAMTQLQVAICWHHTVSAVRQSHLVQDVLHASEWNQPSMATEILRASLS